MRANQESVGTDVPHKRLRRSRESVVVLESVGELIDVVACKRAD